jgi:hypothetical protein
MKLVPFLNKQPTILPSREIIDYSEYINNAIDREIAIGHIADVTDDDRHALFIHAIHKITGIQASGLKLCTRPDRELRCFLLTRHDYLDVVDFIDDFEADINYSCATGYYGFNPPTSLTNLRIGEYGCWVFAVYDDSAEGFCPDTQTMFTGYKWHKQVELFDNFAVKHKSAGTIIPLDHASQGLLLAHDLRLPHWDEYALGQLGYIRFIKLPTDVKTGLVKKHYPYGDVRYDTVCWSTSVRGNACEKSGVVALVG